MYMTVISDNASQARMEAERRLKLMPECSEGWTEDIEEVK
jgi:hypothetical protein